MPTLTRRTALLTAIAATAATAAHAEELGLADHGPAPEFAGIDMWLNGPPLSMAGLRGRVVLVDFWTYSCINCIRTLPFVTRWYDTMRAQGLVVVGVHTPEFASERDTGRVRAAMARFGIHYPVAQDNEMATWQAWGNQYWPAQYLIDRRGRVALTHIGEGDYAAMEGSIRTLLAQPQPAGTPAT